METKCKNLGIIGATAVAMLASSQALATAGYFQNAYGIRAKGMGGAGVADSQDATSAVNNPAGTVNVGEQLNIEASIFSPRRSYTVSGFPSGAPQSFGLYPGSFDSDSEFFPMPHIGWSKQIDENSAFAINMFGNGGMNTDWPSDIGACPPGLPASSGVFCDGRAGVDLIQLFIMPSYSRRLNDNWSIGVGLNLAYQSFEANGISTFGGFSSNPAKLSDNDHDSAYGAGIQLGVEGQIRPGLRFGLAYQSRTWMTEFDDYSGLFAEQGDFDIPAAVTAGVSWEFKPGAKAMLDVQRIFYSDVNSVANQFGALFAGQPLGADNGPGFGWEDITVLKVGVEMEVNPKWTVRAGYTRSGQPITSENVLFNILAPGLVEDHITVGFTHALSKDSDLNFAFMYAPSVSIDGPNPLDPGQNIEIEMNQYEMALGWSKRF